MVSVNYIMEAARAAAEGRPSQWQIEEVEWYSGYAEPGYPEAPAGVCLGNWNEVTRWNEQTREHETVDDTPARLARLLERAGVELEWSDEWVSCSDCGRIFRTSPDSYSWKQSGSLEDGEATCSDCTDPAAHLAALEGQTNRCNTIDTISPADHGYTLASEGHENGWHPGQNANPETIADELRERGITRFLFDLTSVGQFDLEFAVYVHNSEAHLLADDPAQAAAERDSEEGADDIDRAW